MYTTYIIYIYNLYAHIDTHILVYHIYIHAHIHIGTITISGGRGNHQTLGHTHVYIYIIIINYNYIYYYIEIHIHIHTYVVNWFKLICTRQGCIQFLTNILWRKRCNEKHGEKICRIELKGSGGVRWDGEGEIAEWKRIRGRMNTWREGYGKHSFIHTQKGRVEPASPIRGTNMHSVGNIPYLHPVRTNIRKHARAHIHMIWNAKKETSDDRIIAKVPPRKWCALRGVLKHGCSASAAESAQQSEFPGNPAKLSGNSCILAFCGSKRRSMF